MYSYAVEKPLSVGHKVAGYLPSLFWGFITLGRLISIPISSRVKPATMAFVNVVSGLLSLLGNSEEPFTRVPPLPQDICLVLDSASGGSGGCRSRGRRGEGRGGERCWWGRDANLRGGACLRHLGNVLSSLWASNLVPIEGRAGGDDWCCLEQIPDGLPGVVRTKCCPWSCLVHLSAQLVRALWPRVAKDFPSLHLWAGAWEFTSCISPRWLK